MSPEAYQALADLVDLFPRIVMVALCMALAGLLVAAAFAEVVIRYGESGPAEYSRLDRFDGLPHPPSFSSHVATGREVTPSAGVLGHLPAGVETPGRQGIPPVARRLAVTAAPSQPLFPAAGAGTAPDDPLLSAGLPPSTTHLRAVRLP